MVTRSCRFVSLLVRLETPQARRLGLQRHVCEVLLTLRPFAELLVRGISTQCITPMCAIAAQHTPLLFRAHSVCPVSILQSFSDKMAHFMGFYMVLK